MKNRMRLAWQREVGRAGWPVANRLQCNLHSCGWISDVGVLYKGIWLPAELHDIQLAPWRVSTHTHVYEHRRSHMSWYRRRQGARKNSVWFIYWIISTLGSGSPDRHGDRHSTLGARHSLSAALHPALWLPEVPVNQHALALPLAQQMWYPPRKGPIMAVNPPLPQVPSMGSRRRTERCLASRTEIPPVCVGGWLIGSRAAGMLAGQTYMNIVNRYGAATDVFLLIQQPPWSQSLQYIIKVANISCLSAHNMLQKCYKIVESYISHDSINNIFQLSFADWPIS